MHPWERDEMPDDQGDEIIRAASGRVQLAEDLAHAQWEKYRAAGMPYGETDDGMLRWVMQELLRNYRGTLGQERS